MRVNLPEPAIFDGIMRDLCHRGGGGRGVVAEGAVEVEMQESEDEARLKIKRRKLRREKEQDKRALMTQFAAVCRHLFFLTVVVGGVSLRAAGPYMQCASCATFAAGIHLDRPTPA